MENCWITIFVILESNTHSELPRTSMSGSSPGAHVSFVYFTRVPRESRLVNLSSRYCDISGCRTDISVSFRRPRFGWRPFLCTNLCSAEDITHVIFFFFYRTTEIQVQLGPSTEIHAGVGQAWRQTKDSFTKGNGPDNCSNSYLISPTIASRKLVATSAGRTIASFTNYQRISRHRLLLPLL